jgi:hypothetical protein
VKSDPGLTHKHQTRLERLARDKRSRLLRKVVTYGRKSFVTLAPGVEQDFRQAEHEEDGADSGQLAAGQCRHFEAIHLAQCYKTFYGCNLQIFIIRQSVCPWQAFPVQSIVLV